MNDNLFWKQTLRAKKERPETGIEVYRKLLSDRNYYTDKVCFWLVPGLPRGYLGNSLQAAVFQVRLNA